jgi:class 3 adenylate cyclase
VIAQGFVQPTGQVAHGERRQITVMFCDLAGSTQLSERLDAEVLSRLIGKYYAMCREIIAAGGGFVARLVGDGVLAYFGYPEAPENGAESAIRTSLWMLDRLPE